MATPEQEILDNQLDDLKLRAVRLLEDQGKLIPKSLAVAIRDYLSKLPILRFLHPSLSQYKLTIRQRRILEGDISIVVALSSSGQYSPKNSPLIILAERDFYGLSVPAQDYSLRFRSGYSDIQEVNYSGLNKAIERKIVRPPTTRDYLTFNGHLSFLENPNNF